MKNRPAYIQDIVNRTNEYLKRSKVVYQHESDLFNMTMFLLLDKGYYNGFNWFVEAERTMSDGTVCKFNDFAYNPQNPTAPEDVEGAFVQLL